MTGSAFVGSAGRENDNKGKDAIDSGMAVGGNASGIEDSGTDDLAILRCVTGIYRHYLRDTGRRSLIFYKAFDKTKVIRQTLVPDTIKKI